MDFEFEEFDDIPEEDAHGDELDLTGELPTSRSDVDIIEQGTGIMASTPGYSFRFGTWTRGKVDSPGADSTALATATVGGTIGGLGAEYVMVSAHAPTWFTVAVVSTAFLMPVLTTCCSVVRHWKKSKVHRTA